MHIPAVSFKLFLLVSLLFAKIICDFFFAVITQWQRRKELPNVLPELNHSQYLAVDKALNSTFTVIQGPPGKS